MKVIVAVISILLVWPVYAQKLVDPDKVAPEYHDAAVKRRSEQINQMECAQKANMGHVLPRDRTAFIIHCLDEVGTGEH